MKIGYRILHLISARKYIGEAARVVDLAEAQRSLGHEVLVLVRQRMSVAVECSHRGIPYQSLHFSSRFHLFYDWQDVRLIRRLVRERGTDIVHVHRSKEHWLAAWALRRWTLPENERRLNESLARAILSGAESSLSLSSPLFLRTRHVVTPIANHLANRWLYRHTDGVICVSEAVRRSFLASLPSLSIPLRVIPGGIRTFPMRSLHPEQGQALRRLLDIPPHALVVTLLARIDEVKGHRVLIQAMPRILARHPETIFLFAYPRQSRYREIVEEEIRRWEVGRSIRWLGKQDSITPILLATDVGVIPSIGSEGWSRVAVEFMMMGIPVVASQVGSLPEIVEDGKTGFLVPPHDPILLAQSLSHLLDSPVLRQRMGQQGKIRSELYTHTRMAEEEISFYRELLRGYAIDSSQESLRVAGKEAPE